MEITTDAQIVLNATLDAFGKCSHVAAIEHDAIRLFCRLYDTIQNLTLGNAPAEQAAERAERPAVPIAESVQDDHIVSLLTGEKLLSLKRHLTARGMTPESYRARFGLPDSYPMVCPAYGRKRADLARKQGLGTTINGRPKAA